MNDQPSAKDMVRHAARVHREQMAPANPERRMPHGSGFILGFAISLFLWGLIGLVLWVIFG